jgi:glycosyltransferase involved in cell wall biosynthesis
VFGDKVKVKLAIDLADSKPVVRFTRTKSPDHLKLYFLGRISPVKNLIQCLQILQRLESDIRVEFDVFGPVEDEGYFRECKKLSDSLPSGIKVEFKGQVDNATLPELLKNYHSLFLLTENENYGHAIVEGLTAGCPVIISDRTPWRNLESSCAGWDLSLKEDRTIIQVVTKVARMDQKEYNLWMDGAFTKAESIVGSHDAVKDNLALFED